MLVKGTRLLTGQKAKDYIYLIDSIRKILIESGYEEIIVSSLCDQQLFIDKAGPEIVNQLFAFNDKGARPICLIPEVTAVVDRVFKEEWVHNKPKPVKVFYVARCYRYEKPQEGRYREFTQIGVELLGGKAPQDKEEIQSLLKKVLNSTGVVYEFKPQVTRGLHYYVEDGFEVECSNLGAQKQIAGGGRYDTGIGFGIGVERLLLALEKK